MFEPLYELFFAPGDQNSYQAFTQYQGYQYASWILIITVVLIGVIYYYVFGNQSPRWAKLGIWGLSMLIAFIIVLPTTAITIGFNSFQVQSMSEILPEVWMFGLWNSLFTCVFYVPVSLLLKLGSKHARYIPF